MVLAKIGDAGNLTVLRVFQEKAAPGYITEVSILHMHLPFSSVCILYLLSMLTRPTPIRDSLTSSTNRYMTPINHSLSQTWIAIIKHLQCMTTHIGLFM